MLCNNVPPPVMLVNRVGSYCKKICFGMSVFILCLYDVTNGNNAVISVIALAAGLRDDFYSKSILIATFIMDHLWHISQVFFVKWWARVWWFKFGTVERNFLLNNILFGVLCAVIFDKRIRDCLYCSCLWFEVARSTCHFTHPQKYCNASIKILSFLG